MKAKPIHKFLSLALIVAMAFAILPVQAKGAVNIQSGPGTVKAGLSTAAPPFTAVGFAGKQWDVIGYNGTGVYSAANTMTLLLKNGQSVGADGQFNGSTVDNKYNGSRLQAAMNNAYAAIADTREKGLVQSRSLGWTPNYGQTGYNADGIGGISLSNVAFWPLSVAEANQVNSEVRKSSSTYWWLRTPGSVDTCEAYVDHAGGVWPEGFAVGTVAAYRPAFRLNASEVLFTSDAVGGKAGATGVLSSAAAPTGVIKLTVNDADTASLNLTVTDKSARALKSGQALSVAYTGAVTGTGKYVSCVIAGADGRVNYYGKLKDLNGGSAAPEGTASITLPADMSEGAYTLRLFNEEIKGDNETDFASTPEDISLTVDAPPVVSAITPANGAAGKDINGQIVITFSEPMNTTAGVGSVSLSGGSDTITLSGGAWSNGGKTYTVTYNGLDTNTQYTVSISGFKDLTGNAMTANSANQFTTGGATSSIPLVSTLGFGGKQWLVVGNHGQGVYSAANTMTLLLKSGQSVGVKTAFDASSNIYGTSDLKAALDAAFSSGWSPVGTEKNLIQERTLAGGSGNQGTGSYDSDKIAGDPVEGAKFWPLSVYEYNQLPTSARAFGDSDGWWLRSPGYNDFAAAMVKNSTLYDIGSDVSPSSPSRDLRPAFQFYTGTFLFTSPAVGGKSGPAGGALSAVTPPSGSSVLKLTLKNSNPAVLNLNVGDKTPRTVSAGETFSVAYTGAKTGAGKYVSCILVGADGSVKYYGKLKDLTGSPASPDGVADITFPADLPAGAYTLRLFNEQINADNVSDVASPPEDISLTVDTLPAVATLTPANGSADVATSGHIVITFSDPMNTAAGAGAVSLSGGGETKTLSGGVWSNGDTTYTVDYTGLYNDTEYTVSISGFKDKANNVMRVSSNRQFTTGSWTSSIPLTAIVGFGGKQWAVIGNNGQGVYSAANTMTLLLQDGHSFGGTLRFDSIVPHSNTYSDSDLKIAMDSAFNGLPQGEKDLVQGRALAGGSGNYVDGLTYDPDKIVGAQVDDANFWPLSEYEYGQLSSSLRLFGGTDGWWLRSPGSSGDRVIVVYSTGNINPFDGAQCSVYKYHVLRPAFRMNLQSVFFTSPSSGGKPGAASDTLSAFSQPTGPMKFTMQDTDTARLNLSVSDKSPKTVRPGAALALGYTGAVTGTGKFVSCVIAGASNTIKYYGKLVDLTGGSAESDGAASITLPADMPEGTYTLRLFNEEIKGNNETDFASTPEDISLTVDADAPLDKILVSVTAPTAITGLANGTAKTASALSLPSTVTLVTNDGNVSGNVTWDVASSSYDPSVTTEQTFTVSGTVTLPGGVVNPNSVSLSTGISVTVAPSAFVPVTGINDVPAAATAGVNLPLTGTVAPANATNQTIVWSVQNAGTTGAAVSGNTLSTTAAGTVTVRATITNGLTASTDYTQDFNITVNPASVIYATIFPNTGSFDKFAPADVRTTVAWGSATGVTDVKAGGISIGAGNYSVSGNTLTIKKEYLAAQFTGSLPLTVEFDKGAAATLTIAVNDTTPPTISPTSGNYDLNAPADKLTAITWNSAVSVTDVVYGVYTLTENTDFTLAGDDLTIKDDYLSGLSLTTGDTLDFDIIFDTGATVTLTVHVVDNYTPSDDTDLSSLSVNGTPVSAFDPDVTVYNVELPYGASSAIVTATTGDPNAGYTVTPASVLPGSAIVTVTAEDGTTTKTYTINFTIGAPSTISVTGITSVPTTATAGTPLMLTGTVVPADATNQTIVWSVKTAGDTGATISGSTLFAIAAGTVTVTATIANGASESTNYVQDFNITVNVMPVTTYTVTFNSNGSVHAIKNVNAGESIGSADWPDNPTRNSYTFGGWFTGENGAGAQFTSATPVNATTTVYAKWTYSGGGGGGGVPTTPGYNADVEADNGTETTLPVTVNKDNGSATVDTGSQQLTSGGTVITIPKIPNVGTYSVGIPVSSLSTLDGQGMLTLDTDAGSVTVPSNMLAGVSGISGSKAEITIGEGNKSGLPEDVKAAIGDRPLVQLTLSVDGKQAGWSNPDAPVTVRIPYTPTAAELQNPESIVIWYIDGGGNVVTIPNGLYDPETEMVTFSTTHFSLYAVTYKEVSFNDVAAGAWYSKAVSFIAVRGITTGTGNGNYSPDAGLTRGEFIVLTMRACGIAPAENPTDNFSDAGNTYYTGYLAAAKRLGISAGVGGNLYAPGKEITRQEMFTLLYNALNVIGQLPQGDSGKTLSEFSDARLIDAWALDAMTLLVETGTVGGNNGKLTPTSTTTRAEMAQVLYNLISK